MAGRLQQLFRPRRHPGLVLAGAAVAVIAAAFAGGAVSGKLEHRTTYQGSGSLPPVVTTTSTIPPAAIAAVKAQAVEDMTLDVESQRLEADINRRAALSQAPAAIAARHAAITTAWAPDKVASVEVRYDHLVLVNARDRKSPSVVHAAFIVASWTAVTVDRDTATAVLRGHYQLTEPATVVNQPDQTWTIHLRLSGGRWRLEDRAAA